MLCVGLDPKSFVKSDLNQTFTAYKILWGRKELLAESEHRQIIRYAMGSLVFT